MKKIRLKYHQEFNEAYERAIKLGLKNQDRQAKLFTLRLLKEKVINCKCHLKRKLLVKVGEEIDEI